MVDIYVATFAVAVLALAVNIFNTYKSNLESKRANEIAKGQAEMQIRAMISGAELNYQKVSIQHSTNTKNKVLEHAVKSALEVVLNAYDEACAKYNDNKIDRIRFKQLYIDEIRNIVEDENTKVYYQMPQSKYKATIKVYDEWNNLEK